MLPFHFDDVHGDVSTMQSLHVVTCALLPASVSGLELVHMGGFEYEVLS